MIVILIVGFCGMSLLLRHFSLSQKLLTPLAELQTDLQHQRLSQEALAAYAQVKSMPIVESKVPVSQRRMRAKVKKGENLHKEALQQEEKKRQQVFVKSYEGLLLRECKLYDAFMLAGKNSFFKGATYSLDQLREYARLQEKDLDLFEKTLNKGQRKLFATFQKIQIQKVKQILDSGMLMNDQLSLLRDIQQNLAYQRVLEFDKELGHKDEV